MSKRFSATAHLCHMLESLFPTMGQESARLLCLSERQVCAPLCCSICVVHSSFTRGWEAEGSRANKLSRLLAPGTTQVHDPIMDEVEGRGSNSTRTRIQDGLHKSDETRRLSVKSPALILSRNSGVASAKNQLKSAENRLRSAKVG